MANLLQSTITYLEIVNQQPPIHTMTPDEVRDLRANAQKIKLKRQVDLEKIDNLFIAMRDMEQIPVRIYTPMGNGPFPIIIYYHGGGWVLNDIETCDATCQQLAAKSHSIVISVGYRLAPEYKFPIPLYDAYDAFLWTVKNANGINGRSNDITVMGDSAGGNLATVVTLMNKELHGPKICAQVLLYPVTDLSFSTESYKEFAEGFGLQKKDMEWFAHYYLDERGSQNHPYAAPLKAKELNELPPACIIVAENDILKDEGLSYAEKLKDFGNYVETHIATGLVHSYFTKNGAFSEEIEETMETITAFLNRDSVNERQ